LQKKKLSTKKNWKAILSPIEYEVMREKGTEKPFSGTYNAHFEEGTYRCKGCNSDLFDSTMKFESHCGWPSFDNEIKGDI
jgi:peptide-methionine (R)-S-oxide reductase